MNEIILICEQAADFASGNRHHDLGIVAVLCVFFIRRFGELQIVDMLIWQKSNSDNLDCSVGLLWIILIFIAPLNAFFVKATKEDCSLHNAGSRSEDLWRTIVRRYLQEMFSTYLFAGPTSEVQELHLDVEPERPRQISDRLLLEPWSQLRSANLIESLNISTCCRR